MVEFLRFGQFVFTEKGFISDDDMGKFFWNLSHNSFTALIRQYYKYLVEKQVCPICAAYPLAAPDHQNEVVHCHACGWRET